MKNNEKKILELILRAIKKASDAITNRMLYHLSRNDVFRQTELKNINFDALNVKQSFLIRR